MLEKEIINELLNELKWSKHFGYDYFNIFSGRPRTRLGLVKIWS